MRRKKKIVCVHCGRAPIISNTALCRKHRIQDLKLLSKHIEEGKRLIAGALSEENKKKWALLTSQRKKLAVFQCWEFGWLYWDVQGSKTPKSTFLQKTNFINFRNLSESAK